MATLDPTVVYSILRAAGATAQEATTLTAIAGPESGYRTEAHNGNSSTGDNSYGLFQINMLGSMGASRLKTFGLTANEDLYDPVNNAKAALSILRSQGLKAWTTYTSGAYKQYLPGAQTAAKTAEPNYQTIAYYTRPPTGGWQQGGPMTDTTTATGTTGTDGAVGAPDLPPNATQAQITAYIQKYYPQAAPFLANPEIAAIFTAPGAMHMDSIELEAKLRATNYWQTHGPESRAFDAMIGSSPDAATELVDQTKRTLTNMFAKQGVTLADGDANVYARQMIRSGYINLNGQIVDQNAVQNLVADHIKGPGGLPAGEAANTADAMVALAKQFLVPISRSDAEQWSLNIMRGTASQESFQSWLTGLAKARFASQPDILAAIDSGMTPSAYFTGSKNAVGSLLEVDPSQIDLTDPKWSWMIETVDKNGNRRAPTLGEVQQMARDRPEFATTQQYQDSSASYALQMSKFIGAAS